MYERAGRNLVMRRNAFTGMTMNTLVTFQVYASGHVVREDVVEGLALGMDAATWDKMGDIVEGELEAYPDPAPDITGSQLATANELDDNCFVTDLADFLAYGRRRRRTASAWDLAHLSLSEAREVLGYELASDVVAARAAVFGVTER